MEWARKLEIIVFFLLIVFLPTQLGRHFWPEWAYISGVRVDYFSPTFYLTDILIAPLFVLELTLFLRVRPKILISHFSFLIYLLIGLFVYVNIGASLSPAVTVYKWVKVGEFVFLGWWIARGRNGIGDLRPWLILPVFYESALAAWQFIIQSSVGSWWYWLGERTFDASTPGVANVAVDGVLRLRPYGTLPHPNVLGGFLAISLPLVLSYFLHNSRKLTAGKIGLIGQLNGIRLRQVITILALVLGYTALALSMSRSAMVVGVAASFLVVVSRGGSRKMGQMGLRKRYLIAGAGAILLLAAAFLWPRIIGGGSEESFIVREKLNAVAVSKWVGSPLLGTGLGTSPLYSLAGSYRLKNFALAHQPTHNIYLLLLGETGVAGLAVFLGMIYLTARNLVVRKNYLWLISLFSILALGLVDHYFLTLQQGLLTLTVVVGVGLGEVEFT